MDATALQDYSPFHLRRLLERLREGLYDPLAVRLLTADHTALDTRLQQTLWPSGDDTGAHLCVCGSYGQGKSHTLAYIQALALQQGYVVSAINLDPREVPLHQFRQTYRALMRSLTFPPTAGSDGAPPSFLDRWRAWLRAQPRTAVDPAVSLAAALPATMPHPFKAAITALALPTLEVPAGRRALQQYRDYRPADFPWTLRRTLLGDSVPVARLRPVLKYRQVSFYRQATLAVDNHESFVQMTLALPALFRRMGYRGWVLLFDEGEAIIQGPRPMRARGYHTLHRLLYPDAPCPGLHPVCAFTPDFFQRLHEEEYHLPPFERNYAETWRHLNVYHLQGLSRAAWHDLSATLIALHAAAYHWPADRVRLVPMLAARLQMLPLHDPRATLKALVDELDQVQQQAFFAQQQMRSRD
jgi:bacteriophage exclusion system BrxC/D-like protein